ncbi:MAG: DUF3124 domain-containing protein [Deltaproteobacteria bacterium]|jgi:hypothetical protein
MMTKNLKRMIFLTLGVAGLLFNFSGSASGAVKLLKGQTIYIPSYSNVVSGPPVLMVVPLRANLIIHNTDPSQAITIVRIDHYDTDGKLVDKYLKKPIKLNPLAAIRVIVKEPKKGNEGIGTNFIVQWQAEKPVTEPIIDCLMLGTLGNQGFSFTSQGKIIKEQTR